jgi:hypothetical protein
MKKIQDIIDEVVTNVVTNVIEEVVYNMIETSVNDILEDISEGIPPRSISQESFVCVSSESSCEADESREEIVFNGDVYILPQ